MKGHWSRVNLWEEARLKDLHAISVLSFPNANKKVYFNPLKNSYIAGTNTLTLVC